MKRKEYSFFKSLIVEQTKSNKLFLLTYELAFTNEVFKLHIVQLIQKLYYCKGKSI